MYTRKNQKYQLLYVCMYIFEKKTSITCLLMKNCRIFKSLIKHHPYIIFNSFKFIHLSMCSRARVRTRVFHSFTLSYSFISSIHIHHLLLQILDLHLHTFIWCMFRNNEYTYLPINISIHLSIYLSIHLSTFLSFPISNSHYFCG